MDDRNELEAKVLARVLEALPPQLDRAAVTRGTHLRRDLGLDSLGLASFLFRCGEGLEVDQDELIEALTASPIHTIADAVAVFAGLLGGTASGVSA